MVTENDAKGDEEQWAQPPPLLVPPQHHSQLATGAQLGAQGAGGSFLSIPVLCSSCSPFTLHAPMALQSPAVSTPAQSGAAGSHLVAVSFILGPAAPAAC